jgi:hypothetical protein
VQGVGKLIKLIEDFRQSKLQIDFIELKLTQNKGSDPVSYTGTGYIRQTDDDLLTFKLYSVRTENTNFADEFNKLGSTKSGALYQEDDYFTLIGTAIDGSSWMADSVLSVADWLASSPNPVVKGSISHCARGKRATPSRGMRMHYFEKADIPCLIDQVRYRRQLRVPYRENRRQLYGHCKIRGSTSRTFPRSN